MRVRASLKLRRSSSGFQIRRSSNHARRALYEERVLVGCFGPLFVACCHFWAPFSLRAVISGPPCEKHLFAGDLAGTQAAFSRSLQDGWCFMRILDGFCRQQHHDFVAHWLSGRLCKEEEVVDVGVGQDLCLLARHDSNQSNNDHHTIKVHLIQTTNNLLAFAYFLASDPRCSLVSVYR